MAAGNTQELKPGLTFVLGGARSGKSNFAEQLVTGSGLKLIYLATAQARDDEMRERIDIHRERRNGSQGPEWETIEEPLALADALRNCCYSGNAVLVDCLTLWVTNLMLAEADVEREIENLVQGLDKLAAPVVFVSNEVGMGIVPENAMARDFRDFTGLLHQKIASKSDHVFFIAAGLPMVMKSKE